MNSAAYAPPAPRHDYIINDPLRNVFPNTGRSSCWMLQLRDRGRAVVIANTITDVEADDMLVDIRFEGQRGANDSAIFSVLYAFGDCTDTV
jgi:hypothetical protein